MLSDIRVELSEKYLRLRRSAYLIPAMLISLTFVTGMTDAIGITRLGGVFTSVMTGNMVLLGTAAGTHKLSLVTHTGIAFIGYGVGTLIGARVAGRVQIARTSWPPSVTLALMVELAAFVVFACCWEVVDGRPGDHLELVLLAVNAVALGTQSSAVLRLGISGLSTTYLTGTLTTVLFAIATRSPLRNSLRSVGILGALICGAGIGATLAVMVPRAAPLAMVVVVAAVIVVAVQLPENEYADERES